MADKPAAPKAAPKSSGTVVITRDKPMPAPEPPKKEVKRELLNGTVEVLRLHPQGADA